MKIARMVTREYLDSFHFNYYQLGSHQIARCKLTGIVIDSSSERGAFELLEGKKEFQLDEGS